MDRQNIVLDPDNPVDTDDPWLRERERKLHERIARRKAEAAAAAEAG